MQGGEITLTGVGSMFYLSQRPYLVSGTLRDQLLYPQPPRDVWNKASSARRAMFAHLKGVRMRPDELEGQLETALEAVELDYLLARCACPHAPSLLKVDKNLSVSGRVDTAERNRQLETVRCPRLNDGAVRVCWEPSATRKSLSCGP